MHRVGTLEKAAFVAKMLGTDGGWGARASDAAAAPIDADRAELLIVAPATAAMIARLALGQGFADSR